MFLFTFDMNSSLVRKNPLGLIAAFRKAFRRDEPVDLVVKVSRGESHPADFARLQSAYAEADVRLMNEVLSRADLLALMAAADSYVSLHRAEGFGLGMAEAMLLGKPVVATGYSGNLDFMTPETGYLVNWTPTTNAAPGQYHAAAWAEPDLDHAAELMRRVFDRRDESRAVGARARQAVADLLSPAAYAQRVKARLGK